MAIFGKLCRKKILDNDEEVKKMAFLHEKWERDYESGIAEARENYLFYFNIAVLPLAWHYIIHKMKGNYKLLYVHLTKRVEKVYT